MFNAHYWIPSDQGYYLPTKTVRKPRILVNGLSSSAKPLDPKYSHWAQANAAYLYKFTEPLGLLLPLPANQKFLFEDDKYQPIGVIRAGVSHKLKLAPGANYYKYNPKETSIDTRLNGRDWCNRFRLINKKMGIPIGKVLPNQMNFVMAKPPGFRLGYLEQLLMYLIKPSLYPLEYPIVLSYPQEYKTWVTLLFLSLGLFVHTRRSSLVFTRTAYSTLKESKFLPLVFFDQLETAQVIPDSTVVSVFRIKKIEKVMPCLTYPGQLNTNYFGLIT